MAPELGLTMNDMGTITAWGFQLAYALHSAFWHNGFGHPRSHGCVNLAPDDARWLFEWAGPTLPRGWHAIFPTDADPGTWIHIHGATPE